MNKDSLKVKGQKYILDIEKNLQAWLKTNGSIDVFKKLKIAASKNWVFSKVIWKRNGKSQTVYKVQLSPFKPAEIIRRKLIKEKGQPFLVFNADLGAKVQSYLKRWLLWEENIKVNDVDFKIIILRDKRDQYGFKDSEWYNDTYGGINNFGGYSDEEKFKLSDEELQRQSDLDFNSQPEFERIKELHAFIMKKSNHESIKTSQRIISAPFSNSNPSTITEVYWIYAKREEGSYPKSLGKSGKWLIFVNNENIDEIWKKIKKATEEGLLGDSSKVATAKPNPNATNPYTKVICVYTYDWSDKDVMRIREELRNIGITQKLPYKSDEDTLAGKYTVKGDKLISKYYC